MATNYDINYEDERFKQVEAGKQQALTDVENTYSGMIGETDKYYQAQIDASKEWATTQQQLQQENTDFAIEQIEQQKAQAQKDYTKEQAGAYTDWQKQSNAYGVNAEQMAQSGLANTGYSESSQVSMYNTYQNRVATARESYNLAVLNYNNAIKDAQLQNNSKLAEIAYTALQQELELSLQGFQYKNQLLIEQANKKMEVDNNYYNRYQDVLAQMNQENALAEEVRQYNENMAMQKKQFEEEVRQYNESYQLQKEQFAEEKRQFERSYALEIKQFDENIRQFNEEMERLKKKDAQEHAMEIQRLELQKEQMEQAKKEAERDYEIKQQQLQMQQEQFDKEYQLKQAQFKEDQRQFNKAYESSGSNTSKIVKGNESTSTSKQQNVDPNSVKTPYTVETPYYKGQLSSDAIKYGTMANGYQPQGIIGHGNVKKTGQTIEIETQTLDGQRRTVTQNVWKTSDNKLWYWEGRQNKYIEIPKQSSGGGKKR